MFLDESLYTSLKKRYQSVRKVRWSLYLCSQWTSQYRLSKLQHLSVGDYRPSILSYAASVASRKKSSYRLALVLEDDLVYNQRKDTGCR